MSSKRSQGSTLESDEDSETPLLRDETLDETRKEAPLSITQILVLLLLQTTEPLMSFSIRPYIN